MRVEWEGAGLSRSRVLVLVKTPFQVLAATELADEEGWVERATLILMPSSAPYVTLEQMALMTQHLPWRRVVRAPQLTSSVTRRARRLIRAAVEIVRHAGVELLVVGDMSTSFAPYLATLRPARIVLVDDGMKSLRADDVADEFSCSVHRSWLRRTVFARGDVFRDPTRHETYSVVSDATDGSTRTNRQHWLRDRLRGLLSEDETWIVGQPLVEIGVMTDPDYVSVLRAAVAHDDTMLHYFPHRLEDSRRIAERAAALGGEVARRAGPFEWEPVIRGNLPTRVIGVSSTALLSMRNALPSDVRVEVASLEGVPLLESRYAASVLAGQRFLKQRLAP